MEDLSDEHERATEALQRFAALKRRQNVREVDLSFQEVKDLNLFEVRRWTFRRNSRRGVSSGC